MEENSFEKQLREKVLQAELVSNQSSDKERVWNAVQKRPQRKFYYAAAAVLLVLSLLSTIYFKQEEAVVIVTKAKTDKPIVSSLPKPLVVEPARIMQERAPIKSVESERFVVVIKKLETEVPMSSAIAQHVEPLIAIPPMVNEVVAVTPTVPEFTVQLKRGAPIVEHTDENVIITTLKKFKLKRDTSYIANVIERQPSKIKLTFKKEN